MLGEDLESRGTNEVSRNASIKDPGGRLFFRDHKRRRRIFFGVSARLLGKKKKQHRSNFRSFLEGSGPYHTGKREIERERYRERAKRGGRERERE